MTSGNDRSDEVATNRGRGSGTVGRVAWFHCFSGIAGDMALGASSMPEPIPASSGTCSIAFPSTDGHSGSSPCCEMASPQREPSSKSAMTL